jgi:hypothetical protein
LKTIETLVTDIHALFDPSKPRDIPESLFSEIGGRISDVLRNRFKQPDKLPSLRLSGIGTPDRKLWFQVHHPERGEPLTPDTRVKFLFGDILEEFLLFLVQAAGHTVEGRQDELDISGVKGHRDCVIDGHLVDCKSASSRSFDKFASHGLKEGTDPFGYLDQLNSYLFASQDDPLVTDKDTASFLVMDKTLGHICLDTYPRNDIDYNQLVAEKRGVLALTEPPKELCYEPIPDGKSGNMKLPVSCSYCPFKWECHPTLRKFLYSSGPVYLTDVKKVPRVIEVTKEGDVVLTDNSTPSPTDWV